MSKPVFFRLSAGTTALLLAGLLPSWVAAQTITLTVPYRGAAAKQTASTTVEFDASNIAGGATVTVAGKSVPVPASPCAGLACSAVDTTAAGDDILVRRISGTHRAQVELTYSASFGGNYCSYTGVASSKTFNFTLAGFTFGGATNGYRITSFMAPSDVSCDIPYARVPSQRPSFPAGPVAKLGRLPLNVVLVLDKSGSMSELVPGSADVRWNRLKSSVEQFVKVWQVAGAPPAALGTVSSDGHPDDRLGLVFFNSGTDDGVLDGSFFKSRGATDSPWWTPVNTALTARSPGGATSVGGGISRGRTKLDEVDAVTGDTAIVLFTDGEQNTAPCVMKEGETISFWCNPTVPAAAGSRLILSNNAGVQLAKSPPRGAIFTIGLGEGSGVFADLLEQISQETAGRSRITPTGAAMDTAFVDALVDSLKGSTMSLLARTTGTVPAASTAGPPLEVFVDSAVPRVVFATRWDGRGTPIIEIRRPDGTVVANNPSQAGDRMMVASVDVPAHGPAGLWQARVVRPTSDTTAANYHLSAYAVESRLSYRITESPRTGTGSPVTVTAEVGWDGQGLANLPPGAITVRVERPGENLGNILFDSTARGDPRQPGGDQQDSLRAKLDQLNPDGKLAERVSPKPVPGTLVMADKGLGRYEATFDPTEVGGQYRFRVDMDWNDARTARIKRVETTERQVPVLPTAAATEVAVQRDPGATTAVITLTPKDRYGNYVGPGYGNLFNVQVAGGTPVLPVADPTVRGVYVIRVTGIAPGADPRVKIDFRGQPLRDAPLSQIATGGGGGASGKYAVWLGLGRTFPHGSFHNLHDGALAATLGFEYMLSPSTSIEATLAAHRFEGKGATPDVDVTQLGVNGKWYFGQPAVRPFVTLGAGAYAFHPGSTRFGINAGAGAQFAIAPRWSLEGRYAYHSISGNSPNSRYSTLQLGVRYSF